MAKSRACLPQHLVAVLLVVVTITTSAAAPAFIDDTFDVGKESTGAKQYASFLADMDFHVGTTAAYRIKNHPVLGKQQLDKEPAAWLRIHLTGGSGGTQVTLMIRSDNLYLSGFCNKLHCYAFLGEDKKMLPGSSTPLTFGGRYGDLFGNAVAHRGLDTLVVSRKKAQDHVETLASFHGGADDKLKEPLAFFVLTICEAERFVQIRDKVRGLWGKGGSINDMKITGLVVNWRGISCALLAWDRNGQTRRAWDHNKEAQKIKVLFGIKDAADALSRVHPILQTKNCLPEVVEEEE